MSAIVFSNQKGGPGKTTLSVLFALWLMDKHKQRVCFIDLDSQRNASKTLAAFRMDIEAVRLFAADALPVRVGNDPLVLLPGTRTLVDVERAPAEVALLSFQRQLATLKSSFDAVVIDTPPALGLRMTAALMAADHVVCPIELEEYSIDGVTDMLKTVFGVRQRHNPALRLLGMVANRFNPHSIRQRDALERLFRDYAAYVVPAKISTRSAIPEALAFGQPVWRMTKSSAREATAELFTVFEHLHRRMVECTEEAA